MEFSFIKRLFLLGVLIVIYKTGFSQIINGRLSNLQNSEIRLEVFSGFKSYLIGRAQTDEKGNFTIPFSKEHYGVAYLFSNDYKPFFIIL
jgi:hypothetical protein